MANDMGLFTLRAPPTAAGGIYNTAGAAGAATTIEVTLPLTRSVVLKEEA
jgi:hypothetical protein